MFFLTAFGSVQHFTRIVFWLVHSWIILSIWIKLWCRKTQIIRTGFQKYFTQVKNNPTWHCARDEVSLHAWRSVTCHFTVTLRFVLVAGSVWCTYCRGWSHQTDLPTVFRDFTRDTVTKSPWHESGMELRRKRPSKTSAKTFQNWKTECVWYLIAWIFLDRLSHTLLKSKLSLVRLIYGSLDLTFSVKILTTTCCTEKNPMIIS